MGITIFNFLGLPLLSLASPRDLQDPRVCTFGEAWFTSVCTLTCPDGFAKDENGCDLCRCAEQLEGCSTTPCYYWTTCAVCRTDHSGCANCYPPCADGSMPGIIIG
ncbi:uncharacterized protein LOC144923100 [Branchiostoma floridae x Branchiostoma belcheri]